MRIQSIDALRGLVMIIMALDHTRDFFHSGAMSFQPEDLTRTTATLFFTRWVTHVCAPVFAFTAGVGAYLWSARRRSAGELSGFLWKRGVWLILLDLIVVRFAFFFSLTSGPLILSVLWALGWSMIVLSLLVRLPMRVVAALSIAMILLHNLADRVTAAAFGAAGWIWKIVHEPGVIPAGDASVLTAYPLVPWIAVMAAGFCFGPIAPMERDSRQRWLLWFGCGLTLAFLIVRWLNVYGDPQPWSVQGTPGRTVLAFLRCTKYPPSLAFLLMTLGPAMLIWAWLDRLQLRRYNPLLVFGRVPLFYFIVHLYVIHGLMVVFTLVRYGTVAFLKNPLPSLGGSAASYPPGFGWDLRVVYLVWVLVCSLMYPVCLFMARLKDLRGRWWLSYI